jgi:hypothetical protein
MPRYSGEQNGNSKLTKEAVGDIRSSAESRPVLAARYGVSLSLITAVRHRKVWR